MPLEPEPVELPDPVPESDPRVPPESEPEPCEPREPSEDEPEPVPPEPDPLPPRGQPAAPASKSAPAIAIQVFPFFMSVPSRGRTQKMKVVSQEGRGHSAASAAKASE
ncbi:MAG: hypothetical protein QM704_08890 [Anaeromyxobacteraceae bacterium]